MKKRFFGALLALCLCVALLPVVSMAEEPEDGEWEPTEEEWALLECTDEEVAALTLEQQAQRLALAEKLGISTLDEGSSAATFLHLHRRPARRSGAEGERQSELWREHP